MYVVDPVDEKVVEMQAGGLSAAELMRFLDEGERVVRRPSAGAADLALQHGIELLDHNRAADAAAEFRKALEAGGAAWTERARTLDLLTTTLESAGDARVCADHAMALAPKLARDRWFVDIMLTGLRCASHGGAEAWAVTARGQLEPLARAAMSAPAATRDDRFQLYEALIQSADLRSREAGAQLAARWLAEIEAVAPRNDDERTALDVARVRAVTRLETPARALPALAASERAMPDNYTASARLASMDLAAHRFDEAIAASRRGLARSPGAMGRAGLLLTQARSLLAKGDVEGARPILAEALEAARAIQHEQSRDAYVAAIQRVLDDAAPPKKKLGG